MDKILEVSEADGDAIVQTGVKWEDLNKHLEDKNVPLFFPLDPGPGATIGGMAGTGCSGTNAVRYGTAKAEWFLNLVRLAVFYTFSRPFRSPYHNLTVPSGRHICSSPTGAFPRRCLVIKLVSSVVLFPNRLNTPLWTKLTSYPRCHVVDCSDLFDRHMLKFDDI